jgi:glycosyltransferase involved in cell wall biosynthesis
VNGLLVDPRDLTAFGNAVKSLFEDAALADGLGASAQRRVWQRYLAPVYLSAYLELIADVS